MSTKKPESPFIDAESPEERRPPSLFVGASDVDMALDAGFTKDEIAYMLDLGEPAPDANVDGEDLGPLGEDTIRVIKHPHK